MIRIANLVLLLLSVFLLINCGGSVKVINGNDTSDTQKIDVTLDCVKQVLVFENLEAGKSATKELDDPNCCRITGTDIVMADNVCMDDGDDVQITVSKTAKPIVKIIE